MNISPRNYYLSAITSTVRFQEAEAMLPKKCALFIPISGLGTLSDHVSNNYLYPTVAAGYQALGSVVSSALSTVSESLGNRVEEAWTDPFSSSFLLTVSNWGQRILTPIAASQPLDYPILRPISQSIIGMARFSDIALKDASTVLEAPSRATKIFTSRPWEAFNFEHTTTWEKVAVWGFFILYGACWFAIRVADLTARIFQAVAYQIQFGRGATDAARSQINGVEKWVRNYFIEKIQVRETQVRKMLVGKVAAAGTRKVLRIANSSAYRFLISYGLLFLLASQIKSLDPTNSWISPATERNIVWLMNLATVQTFTILNLAQKTFAYASFFKEFTHEVTPEYDPKSHTIFYRKNLIKGLIKIKKIKNHIKKHQLNNKM